MSYKYENHREGLLTEKAYIQLIRLYAEIVAKFSEQPHFILGECDVLCNRNSDSWIARAQIDRLAELGLLEPIDTWLRDDAPRQYKAYRIT